MATLKELQADIKAWADGVFPDRTAHGALCKLMLEELPELALDTTSGGEYADALILLLDIATLNGIDVEHEVRAKMEKNRARTWVVDTGTGLMHHIDDVGEATDDTARRTIRKRLAKEAGHADPDTQDR